MMLAVIYAGQLIHALAIAAMTEPAACKISTSTIAPAPLCPGLDWDQHTRFLLSLPGAYLSYPIEIGFRSSNPLVYANPQFIIIMLVHVFGWSYGATRLVRWLRRQAAHLRSH